MQNNTKDQHIVPVCYLKNFCDESERRKDNPKVWCYDKLSKSSDFKGVKSICYSHKVYSIKHTSEVIIDENIEDKETVFESHFLHDIEQKYSLLLKGVIDSLNERRLSGEQKRKLSTFIAIQYLRDPMIKGLCRMDEDPFYSLPVEYKKLVKEHPEIKNDPSMMHYMYAYGNKDLITAMTRTMAAYIWTFFYDANDGFCTSDSPLCLGFERSSSGEIKEHLLFPISKNILLQMTKGVQIDNIMFVGNTPQWKINNLNSLQTYYAKKYVVSCKNSFASYLDRVEDKMIMWDLKKMNLYQK